MYGIIAQIDKARQLLTLINPAHLRKVYTHRAARIILIKQEEILHRMLTEGEYHYCYHSTITATTNTNTPILYSLYRHSVGVAGPHAIRLAGL